MFFTRIPDDERDKLRSTEYVKNLYLLRQGLLILGSPSTGDKFTDSEIKRYHGDWRGVAIGTFDDFVDSFDVKTKV